MQLDYFNIEEILRYQEHLYNCRANYEDQIDELTSHIQYLDDDLCDISEHLELMNELDAEGPICVTNEELDRRERTNNDTST